MSTPRATAHPPQRQGSSAANSSPPIRATVLMSRSRALSDRLGRAVAGLVAVRVVDLVQVVDVDEQ
jgi:hypothetical protein